MESPPPSPQPSLDSYGGTAGLTDFPFLLPTPAASSVSSFSSSPCSSPMSLSGDDASEYGSAAPWRPAGAAFSSAPLPPWHEAVVPLSLDRPYPRLPSPPPNLSPRTAVVSSSTSTLTSQGSVRTKKRRRKKAVDTALNAEERLQRRRELHRAVDANRRQKEGDAIARLHELIKQQQQPQTDADDRKLIEETGEEEEEDETDGSKHKVGRLTVLESSIALIEQLTSACKRMNAACNAKDAQVSRVSSQLHSVAAVIAQQASSLALVEPLHGRGRRGRRRAEHGRLGKERRRAKLE